jgi:hypothetical protein
VTASAAAKTDIFAATEDPGWRIMGRCDEG